MIFRERERIVPLFCVKTSEICLRRRRERKMRENKGMRGIGIYTYRMQIYKADLMERD